MIHETCFRSTILCRRVKRSNDCGHYAAGVELSPLRQGPKAWLSGLVVDYRRISLKNDAYC